MTSILERSELNTSDFSYWKILTNNTEVQEKLTIDTLNTMPITKSISPDSEDPGEDAGYITDQSNTDRIKRAKNNFLSGIREYILDETFINEDITLDPELYKEFLDKIIPNNIEIFNRFKQYVSSPLSVYSVLKFLEIFNIYSKDITYDLYQKITDFVEQNIFNYKNNFSINYKTYSRVALKKEPNIPMNSWLQLLSTHKDLNTIVTDAYGFSQEQNYLFQKYLIELSRLIMENYLLLHYAALILIYKQLD